MDKKGLIGIFLDDLDEYMIPGVFENLSRALYAIPDINVDMLICLRKKDKKIRHLATLIQPPKVRTLRFWDIEYDYIMVQGALEPPNEVTCGARDLIRKHALEEGYNWVFFLDGTVSIRRDTLKKVLKHKGSVVAAPYRWKGYPHPVVMVVTEKGGKKILVNPHLYKTKHELIPCLGVGLGATLVRRRVLHVPITMGSLAYVLEGGASGFCENLVDKGHQIYCLSDHIVDNIGPQRKICHMPFLDNTMPLLLGIGDVYKYWGTPNVDSVLEGKK